jgi:hypothetical protein
MIREIDPRSVVDKAPPVERHVAVVVVGAGAAGVAAAIAAAQTGAQVLLVDENPVDNDMMAMDVPLYFGQRMQPSVRNRAIMMERVVEANPALAEAHEAGVDVQLGTYVWGAFVNGPTVRELPGPLLGLADDRRSWLVGYDRLVVAAAPRRRPWAFRAGSGRARWERAEPGPFSPAIVPSPPIAWSLSDREPGPRHRPPWPSSRASRSPACRGGRRGPRRSRGGSRPSPLAACRSTPRTRFARLAARSARSNRWCVVQVDGELEPVAGSEREIRCDTICPRPRASPPASSSCRSLGARLDFVSPLGGWVPRLNELMQTTIPTVSPPATARASTTGCSPIRRSRVPRATPRASPPPNPSVHPRTLSPPGERAQFEPKRCRRAAGEEGGEARAG